MVYLRELYEPVRRQAGLDPADLFPLLTPGQIGGLMRLVAVELARELATMAMLAAAALAVARNFATWLAAFAVAFGVWDLAFYAFLKLLIDWPKSLATWDLLFLLPVPWAGPVLAPVIVSLTLVVCGLASLAREPIAARRWQWTALIAGGLIVILSFIWDGPALMAGGRPAPFRWPVFWCGELLAVAAFISAGAGRFLRNPARPPAPPVSSRR